MASTVGQNQRPRASHVKSIVKRKLKKMSKYSNTGAEDFLIKHELEDTNNQASRWKLLLTGEEIDRINDYVAQEINRRFLGEISFLQFLKMKQRDVLFNRNLD